MNSRYTKEICLKLLREKGESLVSQGRYPKRSDFTDEEVAYIKSFLGPWPRALEAAGLKPKKEDDTRNSAERKRNQDI
mgnify:CR=1 FL=1|jgi:hypothetical protein